MSNSNSRKSRLHHSEVIVVDGSHMPMSTSTRRKAIKAVVTGRAFVLNLRTWARLGPESLCDLKVIQVVVFPGAKAVSEGRLGLGRGNRAILRRDGYVCGYEGCDRPARSVDHIVPRCQGGQTSWRNCISCCLYHNQLKGGRTPEQAGLKLRGPIRSPRYALIEMFQRLVEAA